MCEFLQRHVYFMFYCCVMEKHVAFWNKEPVVLQNFIENPNCPDGVGWSKEQ